MITTGKIARDVTIDAIRELSRDDLGLLKEKRQPTQVIKLRDSHHNIARLIALGISQNEVASRTGYSINRVSTLAADPSVQNLVAYYRRLIDQTYAERVDDYYDLLTANKIKAERMVADQLEDAEERGEALPIRNLLAISRDAADRTGHGKHQTNLNVNADFGAIMEKVLARSGKVIEHTGSASRLLPQPGPVGEGLSPAPPQPFRRRA